MNFLVRTLGVFAVFAFAGALTAQVQTFPSSSLPAGWTMSPGNVSAMWAVDGNPTVAPYQSVPITPYTSAPFSLNYNDGTDVYNGTTNRGGVMSETWDLTFAPNPVLSFQHMQSRYYYYSVNYYGKTTVRIWDSTRTTMLYEEVVSCTNSTRLCNWAVKNIPMTNDWGPIKAEFHYDSYSNSTTYLQNSAGWFIDDVQVTGLTPPGMAITDNPILPSVNAGSAPSHTFTAQNGTTPYVNWRITSGALPAGVTINSTSGALQGTASASSSGSYTFEVTVDDSGSLSDSKTFYMNVVRPAGFVYPTMNLPYQEDFGTDTGWVYSTGNVTYGSSPGNYSDLSQGGWERGATSVSPAGGWYSDRFDPPSDHTNTSDNIVLGVGVGEPYPSNTTLNTQYWAYSPEIDVAGFRTLDIKFWKWINQYYYYVPGICEAYNPTTSAWVNVWTYPYTNGEQMWSQVIASVDFGAIPTAGMTTRIRFGWSVNSTSYQTSNRAGGINIDDLEVIEKPQPGIVTMDELEIVSSQQVGSTAKVYVGGTYDVKMIVSNTSSNPVHIHTYSDLWHLAQVPQNVGNIVFSSTPSQGSPWIIPGNVSNFAISDVGSTGLAPMTFNCTQLPTGGNGGSVIWHVELLGKEQGGLNRATVTDSQIDSTPDEVISVFTQPALTITDPNPLPDASEGVNYSYTFTAQFGTPPYVNWQMTAGPSWIAFDSVQKRISGIAPPGSAPGPVSVTISVDDSANPTPANDTRSFDINIVNTGPGPLQIATPSQLPNATRNQTYTPVAFNAVGGTPPYTWSAAPTWLGPPAGAGTCAGITWSAANAELAGTPTSNVGGYAFEMTVTDSVSVAVTGTFYLSVLPENPTVGIVTPTTGGSAPPDGNEGAPYNGGAPFQFQATGGYQINGGYLWTVTAGEIPSGLALDPMTGELAGTPDLPNTYQFTLRASDGAYPPGSASETYTIDVDPLIPIPLQIDTPVILPAGDEGNFYSTQLTASSGKTPYVWTVKAGSVLPQGISLDPQTGEIVGTIVIGQATSPNEDFTFTIEVTDNGAPVEVAEKTFTMNITAFVTGPLSITTPATLPQAGEQFPYSTWFRATGGNPIDPGNPYQWVLGPTSTLPAGLSLDLFGRLDGVPAFGTAGEHTFDIEVSDGAGNDDRVTFTLQVNGFPNPDPGGAGELEQRKRRTETVPFWEACSVGTGSTGLSLIAIAGLVGFAVYRRRRTA